MAEELVRPRGAVAASSKDAPGNISYKYIYIDVTMFFPAATAQSRASLTQRSRASSSCRGLRNFLIQIRGLFYLPVRRSGMPQHVIHCRAGVTRRFPFSVSCRVRAYAATGSKAPPAKLLQQGWTERRTAPQTIFCALRASEARAATIHRAIKRDAAGDRNGHAPSPANVRMHCLHAAKTPGAGTRRFNFQSWLLRAPRTYFGTHIKNTYSYIKYQLYILVHNISPSE